MASDVLSHYSSASESTAALEESAGVQHRDLRVLRSGWCSVVNVACLPVSQNGRQGGGRADGAGDHGG